MTEAYLDNSATTRVCPEAAEAAMHAMLECYGNPSSTHTKGREAKKLLDTARKQVADALGCKAAELYFKVRTFHLIQTDLADRGKRCKVGDLERFGGIPRMCLKGCECICGFSADQCTGGGFAAVAVKITCHQSGFPNISANSGRRALCA